MQLVHQVDRIGCGIACVAMLTGTTYARVRSEMFGAGPVDYTDVSDLQTVLRKLGYRPAERLVRTSRKPVHLKENAIVKVNRRSDGSWHWVVWDARRAKILDPKTPPYSEARLRFCSYLIVRAPKG